ncbi:MAG: hypothetical protein ACK5H2_05510 [Beutenbergiaceae bacterium]
MMGGTFRAVVTAAAAAGVGIAAFGQRPVLVGTVAACCAIFAIGWPILLDLPSRTGASVVLLLTGAAAIAVIEITGDFAWVTIVLAGAVLAAFIHELARRDGRPRLLESVSGVVTGAVIVTSGVGWLAIGATGAAVELLLAGAVTIAIAAAVSAVPLPSPYSSIVPIVVTAGGGLWLGYLLVPVGMITGLLGGLAAGLLIATTRHLFGQIPNSGQVLPALAAAVLPVAVSGVPVYVLGRVLVAL